MKNRFLIGLYMFIFSCSFFVLLGSPVYSQTNPSDKIEYMYPENKEQVFDETVDEFYQALRDKKYQVHQEYYNKHKDFYKRNKRVQNKIDTVLFKEIPSASVNIRQKLLASEVEKFNYITWDGNILQTYPDIDIINYHQTVNPDRQVYFFYSFKDTEKEFRGRYAIYDVETKEILAGGSTYFPKYPTYKEHLKN
ncbi:hypothetical protein [Mesobacillus foraminis]|uniref:hypothetical protein n=1 Tax=Mesobacillus foraminis TaxID=279826 RepID=UPI000EF4B63B|nr:hypothetical protein [Mesobacillus foraminis]